MAGENEKTSFLIHQEFDDFDGFSAAAHGWDLEFLQLDRGGFNAGLTLLNTPKVVLSKVKFGRKLLQQGETPQGFRTFAFSACEELNLKWRGKEFGAEHMMVFPRGEGLESVSRPGFDVYVVSVSEWLLERFAENEGLDSIDCLLPPGDLVRFRMGGRLKLCQLCKCLIEGGLSDYSLLSNWSYREELEQDLIGLLLESIRVGSRDAFFTKRLTHARRLALSQALDVMSTRAAEPVTVAEVESLIGVSPRTLRYAFSEVFGMSPKSYLNSLRLNRVRNDLLGNEVTGIGDVAKRWGFWHMGQFARDYRKLFGELPSESIRNA